MVVTTATNSLVRFTCTYLYQFAAGSEPIGKMCQIATTHANSMNLSNIFCNGQQTWNRSKWLSLKIHIQTCHYYTYSLVGQGIANTYQPYVKKLCFINSNNIGIGTQ